MWQREAPEWLWGGDETVYAMNLTRCWKIGHILPLCYVSTATFRGLSRLWELVTNKSEFWSVKATLESISFKRANSARFSTTPLSTTAPCMDGFCKFAWGVDTFPGLADFPCNWADGQEIQEWTPSPCETTCKTKLVPDLAWRHSRQVKFAEPLSSGAKYTLIIVLCLGKGGK